MGQLMSKKPKLEINDVDRAVLTLKSQARKLEQQRTRIQGDIDRERQIAKELVAQGRKDRALLALKRRKLQEVQAERLDGWLLNVQGMVRAHCCMDHLMRLLPLRLSQCRCCRRWLRVGEGKRDPRIQPSTAHAGAQAVQQLSTVTTKSQQQQRLSPTLAASSCRPCQLSPCRSPRATQLLSLETT
jgi:charged multivesicular body protein 6